MTDEIESEFGVITVEPSNKHEPHTDVASTNTATTDTTDTRSDDQDTSTDQSPNTQHTGTTPAQHRNTASDTPQQNTNTDPGEKFGEQFAAERFTDATEADEIVPELLAILFDTHNIVKTEPDEPYDNFAAEKALHQILDYNGSDYIIDPFDAAAYGINHRTHMPTDKRRRFDIRKETGTNKPSEFDEIVTETGAHALIPRYATRMKLTADNEFEWLRVIDIVAFADAVNNHGLEKDRDWHDEDTDENEVVAWLYSYDDLRAYDLIVDEITADDLPADLTIENTE